MILMVANNLAINDNNEADKYHSVDTIPYRYLYDQLMQQVTLHPEFTHILPETVRLLNKTQVDIDLLDNAIARMNSLNELQKEEIIAMVADNILDYLQGHHHFSNLAHIVSEDKCVSDALSKTINHMIYGTIDMWFEANSQWIDALYTEHCEDLAIPVIEQLNRLLQKNTANYDIWRFYRTEKSFSYQKFSLTQDIKTVLELCLDGLQHINTDTIVEYVANALYSMAFVHSKAVETVRTYPIRMRDIREQRYALSNTILQVTRTSLRHKNDRSEELPI